MNCNNDAKHSILRLGFVTAAKLRCNEVLLLDLMERRIGCHHHVWWDILCSLPFVG